MPHLSHEQAALIRAARKNDMESLLKENARRRAEAWQIEEVRDGQGQLIHPLVVTRPSQKASAKTGRTVVRKQ